MRQIKNINESKMMKRAFESELTGESKEGKKRKK